MLAPLAPATQHRNSTTGPGLRPFPPLGRTCNDQRQLGLSKWHRIRYILSKLGDSLCWYDTYPSSSASLVCLSRSGLLLWSRRLFFIFRFRYQVPLAWFTSAFFCRDQAPPTPHALSTSRRFLLYYCQGRLAGVSILYITLVTAFRNLRYREIIGLLLRNDITISLFRDIVYFRTPSPALLSVSACPDC